MTGLNGTDKVNELNRRLNSFSRDYIQFKENKGGIALINVNRRIKLFEKNTESAYTVPLM